MSVESQNITNEIAQMIERNNSFIRSWTLTTKAMLKQSIQALPLIDQKTLLKSIKHSIRKDSGEISSVGFGLERHGVFVHKGVGRGRKAGSASADKYRKEWFNPIIEKRVDALYNFVADYRAEMTLTEIQRILIN